MAKGSKSHQYNTWWIKMPTKTEEKNHSFSEEFQHLIYNTTLHCYRWLVVPNLSKWEIFMWIVVHVVGGGVSLYLLQNVWYNYSTNPMVTTLYDTLYPVEKVPFPGVAVCSNNRISYASAIAFSKQLTEKYKNRFNATYFLENLWLLGKLYDSEMISDSEAIAFQTYLDMFESNDTLNLSDIASVMKKLSPQCADMLLQCIWQGVVKECMVKGTMNEFRRTQYGYCCTFNYVRYDVFKVIQRDSYLIEETGPDLGLILLLDGSLSDYHYPLFSFRGFIIITSICTSVSMQVQIFNSHEFPDMLSGGVTEKLVEVGTEAFIRIDSVTLETDREAGRYSPKTRDCLFSNELKEVYGENYRRSDCVVNCRISSIFSLCNCVPFFLPIMSKQNDNFNLDLAEKCSLQHLPCLTHYKVKWLTVVLTLDRIPGLEKDVEDGLYCPQCFPTCSETVYSVTANSLPLLKPNRNNHNILSGVTNISEVAVVRVYHGQQDTWMYKQTVAVKWFEIISQIGGLFGVITGFSLISLVEIMYFIIRRIILAISSIYSNSTSHDETLKIMP